MVYLKSYKLITNNQSQFNISLTDIMDPFQGMKKKRWFKLGFIGMLCTTGVSVGMLAYIYYVMYHGWKQSGMTIDQKLAQEIFEQDNEYFGRKSRSSKKIQKNNQTYQIEEKLLENNNLNVKDDKRGNKKIDYI